MSKFKSKRSYLSAKLIYGKRPPNGWTEDQLNDPHFVPVCSGIERALENPMGFEPLDATLNEICSRFLNGIDNNIPVPDPKFYHDLWKLAHERKDHIAAWRFENLYKTAKGIFIHRMKDSSKKRQLQDQLNGDMGGFHEP